MKNTFVPTVLGTSGCFIAIALLTKHIIENDLQKWRRRTNSKLLDTDIRLALLEYNHLHEDGDLKVFYGNED